MIHKTTRSILSVLLAVLLLVTSIPLTPAFAGEGAVPPQSESGEGRALAGDGTKEDPYKISSAAELEEFRDKVNNGETDAWAELTADINLNPDMEIDEDGTVTNGDKLSEWTPIGNEAHRYTGTFDGDGHTISGLYIDSDADYKGLFGYLSTDGNNIGTVQNLSVSGSVSGGWNVGGVVGYNNGGTVTGCIFSGSGSVSGSYNVGGVVGLNLGSVKDCDFTGSVSGNSSVGGVVGYNSRSSTVENCYNTGAVSGGEGVGGVVGDNRGGSVTNSYNTGSVSGPDSGNSVGGVVGYNSSRGNVTNCYNTGTVTGPVSASGNNSVRVGGICGYNDGTIQNCCNSVKATATVTGSSICVGGICGYNTYRGSITSCSNSGTVTGSGSSVTGSGSTANVGGICGENWGSIENCSNSGPVEGSGSIGGICGRNTEGRIENCSNSGDVSGDVSGTNVGGVVGYNTSINISSTVENCHNIGEVSGNSYVGGVVGYNISSVTNCYNTGTVTGTDDYVGGVVGDNSGSVKNCYNTGEVSGPNSGTSNYVGGVVGDNSGSVTNCYNTGTVTGTDDYVGGVVGGNDSGTVENCYNTGNVSVTGSHISNVGGVVGYNDSSSTVTNCYNTGNVSVTSSDISNVGGVVGYNINSTVENCYNTGSVTVTGSVSGGGWYVGGVVGQHINGSITNCYFLQQNGVPAQGIGEGSGTSSNVEARTADAFHSGEVAWLLENGQAEDQTTPVWGQNIGEDKSPVLTSDQEKTVYRVPVDLNYTGAQADQVIYTNSTLNAKEPIREGYTFDGWYDNQECTGERVTAITDLTDTTATLYAKWTANEYTVTLNTDGGTIAEGQNISSYTYGIGATLPTSVTREGYTFAGWYEKEDFTGDPVAAIGKDAMGDKTYWAKWEEVENPEPEPTPDPTPSGPSTGDSTGWADIRDELENTAKGDQITIDMGDETKVPAEIFESLAGKDVDVTFDLGDIQWSVNGADIPTDTDFTDLDLGVNLDTHGIPVNVINTITGEVGTVQITLAHNGEFGFTMTLTAPLGKENAGYWANLYHYKVNGGEADREDPLGDDESAEALNFEAAAKIDEDGSVTIPFSHASQYAIVIDTHSHATVDVSDLFIDIAPDAWYKDAIQYAYDNGLMTGVSATEFAPEQTTTRAMIVSILARLENVTTAQAAGFADVTDEWYATAVNWAANVGVVNGYEDGTFKPNDAITREQLAAILMNYAACIGQDVSNRADLTSYTDQPSTWAEETMQWAVAEGLISGVTADTLQPQGSAARAQVAAILQRFLCK